jgi:meiotically up-regulated gene 157 (Mug157) protein
MQKDVFERKYEIDSLCYPVRLAYWYWLVTGDASIFGEVWLQAAENIVKTFREQQRKENLGPYCFFRMTDRTYDTVGWNGYGAPVKPVGLIASVFRPSDDRTSLPFLVPSNFMAVSSLKKMAVILLKVNQKDEKADECLALANEVETALKQYAIVDHPKYGKIYAFEVDGFGGVLLMDDSNAPSLLSLPYLTDVKSDDPIYQNTRKFVWSEENPYFFKGKAGEGIGGPHCGLDRPWPMSVIMKGLTTNDRAEKEWCVQQILKTDGDTGFMHESFNKDDAKDFTRSWFAWANTLFGELIVDMYAQ